MKKLLTTVALMACGTVTSLMADAFSEGLIELEHKNYALAAEQLAKACDGGNAKGCYYLGAMYEKGEGIAQNKYAAASLYTQACRRGEPLGCANMGIGSDNP